MQQRDMRVDPGRSKESNGKSGLILAVTVFTLQHFSRPARDYRRFGEFDTRVTNLLVEFVDDGQDLCFPAGARRESGQLWSGVESLQLGLHDRRIRGGDGFPILSRG